LRVKPSPSDRAREWFDVYTRDLSQDDLHRLFTHDTREAYRFFARTTGEDLLAGLPWWKRIPLRVRQVFIAFTLKLPPARRALYLGALLIALLGIIRLFRGFAVVGFPLGTPFFQIGLPMPVWAHGTLALIVSLILVNLLILMEVADRLSLKGELEIAREIQLAMLPDGTFTDGDLQICGLTRPANTVGGDFYDVLPRPDGRVILALGDVAGKGSPAALLMALLLAVLRTLVDEDLDPPALAARLNVQICRHSPASRFITLFYAAYAPLTGALTYVNAGQNPPFIRRSEGTYEELGCTGVALGMFEHSIFNAATTTIGPGDILVLYSDGITEAEDTAGQPLETSGLEQIIERHAGEPPAEIGRHVLKAVEKHTGSPRFHDDLTILILKRRQSNA
jgi:sigma-B regulation protein RsbU (phosphoserine phosphatase)